MSLVGELTFRAQGFRPAPASMPDWKKGFFALEIGLTIGGEYFPGPQILDCVLQESKAGDLYVVGPNVPMIKRANGAIEILQDADGRERYKNLFVFPKDGTDEKARITEFGMEVKNAINDAAITAYRSVGTMAAGVGSRQAKPAPAGAARTTTGGEKGLPGDRDDDDLPF